jgi:hypothetical protein
MGKHEGSVALSSERSMNTSGHKTTLQDGKKGTERGQTKIGKTHVDYWYAKVKKRHFVGRDGNKHEVPDWQVRMKYGGREIRFNLKTANRAEAAAKAKEIYVYWVANGAEATLEQFKEQTEKHDDTTVEKFADIYREQLALVEYPPLRRTAERYISNLFFICRWLKIKFIALLTTEKVSEFRTAYLKEGLKEGREDASVKASCNTHLRGAASLFSKQMVDAYKEADLEFANPFVGRKFRRLEIKPYTPLPRELLDSIWKQSAKLRDGDPNAPAPVRPPRRKRRNGKGKKLPRLKEIRWKQPDWRQPHPEAYTILLLELGIGFRRHESDKAQWDWLFTDKGGRRFIEVRKTEHFTPKGKRRRILPVEQVLWDALQQTRRDVTPFIVPGKVPKKYTPDKEPKHIMYRCEKHHRVLVAWLRKMGIDDSNPCHLLRKEFGSYVATSFGLFVAQRYLGHSTPAVTEAFYAGLTNLPELQHAQIPQESSQASVAIK